MKFLRNSIFVFTVFGFVIAHAQERKFTAGLNFRVAFLDFGANPSNTLEELSQVKLSYPISIRYYSKSIIGFQYQLEYRKEELTYFDFTSVHVDPMYVSSSCKFLINSFSMLLKINKSSESNTSLSFGLNHFISLQQKYSQQEIYLGPYTAHNWDSSYAYSNSDWTHLRTGLRIGISREVPIKVSRFLTYWDIYYCIAIYNKQSDVPLPDPKEFGITLGLSYRI